LDVIAYMNSPARRTTRAVLVLLVFLLGSALEVAAGSGKIKWWRSEQFQREMALTPEQVERIDKIFQDAWPALHSAKTDLDRLERELSATIADSSADEDRVLRLIDGVEASRSALGRTRSLMLYRMHRVLTPEQRAILKSLQQAGGQTAPEDRPR